MIIPGLFFWGVQRMPPNPIMPPPVRLSAASLRAMAASLSAIADDKAKYSVKHGMIEIDIHNVTHPAYKPLESLVVALNRYPRSTRFHVAWGCFWGRHGSKTQITYDRHSHRLNYRCEGNATPWGGFRSYSVFTNVTDPALRQDAREHKRSLRTVPFDDDLDVVFNDLPRYGCPCVQSSKWHQQM